MPGTLVFVHDRSLTPPQEDWRVELPPLDPAEPTGHHFAVLLQDPEPDKLARILQAIDRAWEIEGPVLPFLIETSVDFYPRDDRSEDERLVLREQMVALLQRHHWCGMAALMKGEKTEPCRVDARQVSCLHLTGKEVAENELVALRVEGVRQVRADESGRSGDEVRHGPGGSWGGGWGGGRTGCRATGLPGRRTAGLGCARAHRARIAAASGEPDPNARDPSMQAVAEI